MNQPENKSGKRTPNRSDDEPLHTDYPLSEHDEVEEAERRFAKMHRQHKVDEEEKLRDDEGKPVKDTGKK